MNNNLLAQILAEILIDNAGSRLTHALSTGIVAAYSQALAKVPPELLNPAAPEAAHEDEPNEAA